MNGNCFRTLRTHNRDIINIFITWLAPRAGKMTQIARCDWLPERARWSILPARDYPLYPARKKFAESHIINPLLTKFVQWKWLNIGLVLFCVFTDLDFVSVHKHAKKNLANIQPSWPHTWSITHTYKPRLLGPYCKLRILVFSPTIYGPRASRLGHKRNSVRNLR